MDYFLKGYYDGDSRNCRRNNGESNATTCRYVLMRAHRCDELTINSKNSIELYQNSDFTNRYDIINRPTIDDINVISSNCSEIIRDQGGLFEGYEPYLFGNLLGIACFAIAFFLLIWSIIRRHL